MDDRFEKKLKSFLPYIIIIGVVYLLVPALLFINSDAIAYLILIGILPLTALLCCAHYSLHHGNDFMLSFVAPVFFLPAMFLYPIARASLVKALIYLVAYFLCGYLGLTVGDILANRSKSGDKRSAEKRPAERRPAERRPAERRPAERRPAERRPAERRPSEQRTVERFDDEEPVERRPAPQRVRRSAMQEDHGAQRFEAVDPYDVSELDTATTDDDIDAILREIHQRHGN
jgi:hypothetical protein